MRRLALLLVLAAPAPATPAPAAKGPETETPGSASASASGVPPAGDPGHFTVQLLASRDQQAVRELARNHSEAEHMWLYSFLRDGQRWYALCYGVQPDRGAADRAAARLGREGRFGKPWIRRLGDIQALPRLSAAGNP